MTEITLPNMMTQPTGWVCPLCRGVMAPHYPTCMYCKPNAKKPDPIGNPPFGPATTGTPPFRPATTTGIAGSPGDGAAIASGPDASVRNDTVFRIPKALGAPYGKQLEAELAAEPGKYSGYYEYGTVGKDVGK